MISRFEQFAFAISSINRYIQKLERTEMIQHGYKGSFAQYLVTLYRFDRGLTAMQLSELCDKDKAAISRAVTEMEEKGLVLRERVGSNVYRAKILLTEKGRDTAAFVCRRAQTAVEAVGNELTDDERKVMYAALDRIMSRLHNVAKEGIPQE